MVIIKSFLYNLLAVIITLVGFYILALLDPVFGLGSFFSGPVFYTGTVLIFLGGLIRFWASVHYYHNQIAVLSVKPQAKLVTSGPFQYSRNPLYIGILLMMLGSALIFGSVVGLAAVLVSVILLNSWAKVEEKQLTEVFGQEYLEYKSNVRRWI